MYDKFWVKSAGCSEMLMAHAVTKLASRTPGKEAVAMESFAKALRMVSCAELNTCFIRLILN